MLDDEITDFRIDGERIGWKNNEREKGFERNYKPAVRVWKEHLFPYEIDTKNSSSSMVVGGRI